jgi:hypothetical protein
MYTNVVPRQDRLNLRLSRGFREPIELLVIQARALRSLTMSEIIIWQFDVREGCESAFEEAYGPHGSWATLFARSADFRGTELVRLGGTAPARLLTIDRWTTEGAFGRFRDAHAADYEALDARCETLTTHEVLIGRGTSVDGAQTTIAFDGRVHHAVLSAIARDARAPKIEDIAASLAMSPGDVATSLRRLAGYGICR